MVAQEGCRILALGGLHVEMQVAITQVAKIHQPDAGQRRLQHLCGLRHKGGYLRRGHGHVVFDVQPLLCLRQGNALAYVPQLVGLGDAFGHHGIGHAAVVHGGFQQLLELAARMGLVLVVAVFQQHAVGRVAPQGHALLGVMFVHQAQCKLSHHLEARQARTQVAVGQAQQSDGGVQGGHGSPSGQVGFGRRAKFQAGSGDDAQRAFAAHKQVAQVIAGVVFAQAAQAMPDLALRGDHFQPQAQVAGIAIAHHLGAASVGGQVAANGATAFGGQAQGEQQASAFSGLLHGLQHAARLGHQCEVGCVHTADGIHALQAQYHLGA